MTEDETWYVGKEKWTGLPVQCWALAVRVFPSQNSSEFSLCYCQPRRSIDLKTSNSCLV